MSEESAWHTRIELGPRRVADLAPGDRSSVSELRILVRWGAPRSRARPASAMSGGEGLWRDAPTLEASRRDARSMGPAQTSRLQDRGGLGRRWASAGRRRPREPDRKVNSEMNAHIFELNGYVIPA
jgi:hypothetical protein